MSTNVGVNLVEQTVVCPHCWYRFYADKANFISRHAELYGDTVLGPGENRRFAPHEIQRDREGNAIDPKGWKMTERACPRCHLQIPPNLFDGAAIFISLVGAPRSGKTYFLTSMFHGLRGELVRDFGFAIQDSDSHDVRAFMDYERSLFYASDPSKPTLLRKTQESGDLYNKVCLDGADVELPRPFIFTLRPTENNVDAPKLGDRLHRSIVIYDNAGESYDVLKEKAGNNRVTQHLAACDAIFFAFDPLQDPDLQRRLSATSKDPQLGRAAVSHQQDMVLSEAIHRIRRHRNIPEGRLEPLLAVCVQKFDVWKSLLPNFGGDTEDAANEHLIDHSSVERIASLGISALDVEEVNMISLLVRGFILDLCPQFVALAETNFNVVRYFPVGALGTSPEYDETTARTAMAAEMLKVRPANLQPFRVTHPMLWLLHRHQLIHRTRPRTERASISAHATIQAQIGNRLRIMMPKTQQVLVLDREYAGSSIADPATGEKVWIPALDQSPQPPTSNETEAAPSPATVQPAAPPSRSRVAPPKLGLTLSTAPATKRGWFRK